MKRKFFILLCTATIIYLHAFGQPQITKQFVAGGSSIDELKTMCITKDKGFFVVGYSNSNTSGNKTQDSRGSYDYWIVKYNQNGNIQWDKTIGGSSSDFLSYIVQTKDSGYMLGGSSDSNKSGEKTENSKGSRDLWIVKLNKAGKIQWDKTIGGSGFEYLASIEQTKDGGYIIGGSSASNKSGDKTQNGRGKNDYWVIKTDNTGNIQWQRTIGGSKDDNMSVIHQTSDSGYIVGGYSNSNISGEKTENNRCNCTDVSYLWDYWIVKLNSKGQIQWDKTIGGSDSDAGNTVEQTRDGGYIVGGASTSNAGGDKTENGKGNGDYWIVKLNDKGNKQWDKTIGGSYSDGFNGLSLEQTRDGGYIMASGSTSDKSGDKTENSICPGCTDSQGDPLFDYWVVKTDNKGNVQWDKTLGGWENEFLGSVKEVVKNVYLVGGFSYSGISGNKTIASNGNADYWIVKLKYNDSTISFTSVNQENARVSGSSKSTFSVYPNPARDIIYIQHNGRATTFTLANSLGKVVFTQKINGNGSINIAHLPAGVYFLSDNTTGKTQKIVVAK